MANVQTIEIDPVTRVEGHGKIHITLDENGKVSDSVFSVGEFRGFEKFCEGRMVWDMPTLTSRICGVCPVSHHLASVKACEALLGAEPPPAATKLRELLHMGQTVHSHALHFFCFGLPDFISGEDTLVLHRSILGLLQNNRNLAANAIAIRKTGQDIVDIVGGGRLHPAACIPGGLSKWLQNDERVTMYKSVVASLKMIQGGMKLVKDLYEKNKDSFAQFASFPSMYMGLTNGGKLELYDGPVRLIDADGGPVAEFEAKDYEVYIGEHVESTSWTKFPYYREQGFPDGFYRVAPLARLNIAQSIGTPLADAELKIFKQLGNGKPLQSSLFYHYARMIEMLYAAERAKELLSDPEILSHDVRVPVKRCAGEGVGVLEAPRGTLFHHYTADSDGRITKANFIVATTHNNLAMNRSVRAVAETVVKNGQIQKKDLNKLEMAIRCYDPCLSCSTHAYGRMPLEIEICGVDGEILSRYEYGDLEQR
ncbi:MAG: Ni/Fe hydrogenase subunit alpha [Desulfobacterales bacterium]|nr:Ni/Fe hydrogenase subunit alpha [Desulfobacterales bacterium]